MAGKKFKIRTEPIATGAAAKTILQIAAAANHAVWIKSISISFAGISNTAAPIPVHILRQTTAGTMTAGGANSTIAPDPDDSAETMQTTIRDTATVEPTASDILWSGHVHPQGGWDVNFSREDWIKIGGGDRLGIRTTAAADVNVIVSVSGEE